MSDGHEIHIGDVGTIYRVPIFDHDLIPANFNPSGAIVKQLYWRQPGVVARVERDATAEQITIDGVSTWCLTYAVTTADVVTDMEFHQATGKIQMQGYIEYTDGSKWSSDILTTDYKGRSLKVARNLS